MLREKKYKYWEILEVDTTNQKEMEEKIKKETQKEQGNYWKPTLAAET